MFAEKVVERHQNQGDHEQEDGDRQGVLLHLPEKVEGGDQAVKQTGQVFTVVHLHGLHPVHRSGNGRDRTDLFDVSYVQL